ncbi:MAG: DUF1848 family protein [Candidatus Omnitrophica bacterium]|nr:DUF1848 family protein [Candidatus Omnitrophota bacterium]
MSLITPFDPWKSKWCSCPPKYSLSAYIGCGHKCLYCYASSYIKNFFSPRPKNNFIKQLGKEIKKLPLQAIITMCNSSDPYLPLEKYEKLTLQALKILKNTSFGLIIVTKSSLILRDKDILKEIKNLVISITITTLNKSIAKILEPHAPSPSERLSTIENLSRDLNVVCRLDPLIYPINTREVENIVKEVKNRGAKQIVISTYKVKPDNFKRMIKGFPEYKNLWHNLYIIKGERINRYIYLPQELRRKIIEEVKEIARNEKIEFSTCREGFSFLNTKNCDGSSFLI